MLVYIAHIYINKIERLNCCPKYVSSENFFLLTYASITRIGNRKEFISQ